MPSAGQKIPVESRWYLPLQKIPLAENRFLQAVRELKIQRKNPGSAYDILKDFGFPVEDSFEDYIFAW